MCYTAPVLQTFHLKVNGRSSPRVDSPMVPNQYETQKPSNATLTSGLAVRGSLATRVRLTRSRQGDPCKRQSPSL
jgi:hypothetical protein